MNGMIQIVGYMVAAYGASPLLQTTTDKAATGIQQLFGIPGVVAMVLLAAMLTTQADAVAGIASGF